MKSGHAGLDALSTVLTALGRASAADDLARDVMEALQDLSGVDSVVILVRRSGGLHLVGRHPRGPGPFDDLDLITTDGPLVTAALEGEIAVSSPANSPCRVGVPIVMSGFVIGVYGVATATTREWRDADLALLDAVASLLALWLASPASGLLPEAHPGSDIGGDVRLSPRQCAILRLLDEGKSLSAVSRALSYSESTVKQDLRSISALLGTDGSPATLDRARQLGLCGLGSP